MRVAFLAGLLIGLTLDQEHLAQLRWALKPCQVFLVCR